MTNLAHVPVSGLYPVEDWKPGEIIADVHEICVPPTWNPGAFNLYLGFWYPDDGLTEILGSIEDDGNQRARLFQIPVVRR